MATEIHCGKVKRETLLRKNMKLHKVRIIPQFVKRSSRKMIYNSV